MHYIKHEQTGIIFNNQNSKLINSKNFMRVTFSNLGCKQAEILPH